MHITPGPPHFIASPRPETCADRPPNPPTPRTPTRRLTDSRAAEGVLQALEAAGAGRALREHPLLRHNACVFRAGEGALQVGGN